MKIHGFPRTRIAETADLLTLRVRLGVTVIGDTAYMAEWQRLACDCLLNGISACGYPRYDTGRTAE